LNSVKGVFSDKAARQAVNQAVDVDAIIDSVLSGNAQKSSLPVLPASWLIQGINASNDPHDDSDKKSQVARLLEDGGWKQSEKGYYKNISGVRKYLDFEILVNNNNPTRISVCNKVAGQLSEYGIKAKVRLVAWNELLGSLNSGKYDMEIMGVRVPQYPDISFLYSNSYIPALYTAGADSGRNISGYNNAVINSSVENLYSDNDSGRRKALFGVIAATIKEDVPYIGLYFNYDAVLFSKNVRGDTSPDTWDSYNGISGWYVRGGNQ
jgi:peptide/nickel transport system substrate-binding protein